MSKIYPKVYLYIIYSKKACYVRFNNPTLSYIMCLYFMWRGVERKVKDKQFLGEYFNNGFNATQAYKSVHPNIKGSKVRSKASLMMTMPKVQECIKEKQ